MVAIVWSILGASHGVNETNTWYFTQEFSGPKNLPYNERSKVINDAPSLILPNHLEILGYSNGRMA